MLALFKMLLAIKAIVEAFVVLALGTRHEGTCFLVKLYILCYWGSYSQGFIAAFYNNWIKFFLSLNQKSTWLLVSAEGGTKSEFLVGYHSEIRCATTKPPPALPTWTRTLMVIISEMQTAKLMAQCQKKCLI
jgi:hypothetical protein